MPIRTWNVRTGRGAPAAGALLVRFAPAALLGWLLSSTLPAQTTPPTRSAAEASDYTLACAIGGIAGRAAVRPCAELGAAQRCRHESDFSSRPSQERTGMTIVNRNSQALKLYWLSFAGSRRLYHTVEPGDQVTQQTFLGHNWLIATAEGDCVGIFNASPAAIAFF